MNPLAREAIESIIRAGLQIGAGYFVAHGVWTQAAATTYVAAAAVALVTLGWSIYQKKVANNATLTALTMPSGSTVQELNAVVKAQ